MTSIPVRSSLLVSAVFAMALLVSAAAQAQTAGATVGAPAGTVGGTVSGTASMPSVQAMPIQGTYVDGQSGLPPVFQSGVSASGEGQVTTQMPQGAVPAQVIEPQVPVVTAPVVTAPAGQAAVAVEAAPAVEDPCASYKDYPDYYATCQDRMNKLKRMQDAKTKRVQDAKAQADALQQQYKARTAPATTTTAAQPNRVLGQPKVATQPGTVPATVPATVTPVTTTAPSQ